MFILKFIKSLLLLTPAGFLLSSVATGQYYAV
jgi:hypothetical protein